MSPAHEEEVGVCVRWQEHWQFGHEPPDCHDADDRPEDAAIAKQIGRRNPQSSQEAGYRKGGSGAAPFTNVLLVYALWAIVLLDLIQSCALLGYSQRSITATITAIRNGMMSKRPRVIQLKIW